ncbi:phosphodiester glycosidase family protein [Ferrimicrobium sp.]|uniref:phosphodiester glycosidase family protein n=1 Tax=Ferrimicrobium sp. TaxID=2926050 RepID=UPI0026274E53|nr:phosphodiester glycosidase family protein [Ferrimicrobium sp.]
MTQLLQTPTVKQQPKRHSLAYRRVRAIAVAGVVVAGGYGGVGMISALGAPGSASLGVKFVEWVRGNGGASIVQTAENIWYTTHQPAVGGEPPKGSLRPVASVRQSQVTATSKILPAPKAITPIASPPLPHEGQWTPEGPLIDGSPALYVTLMRPDKVHTSLVAGVAWMDPHLVSFLQYAGAQEPPGGGAWPYMAPIQGSQANNLVAAFNSGFRMSDAQGGYYAYGRMAVPLRNGAASFVVNAQGTATVEQWTHGQNVPSSIKVVRQNLVPLVESGKINPVVYSSNYQVWGTTVGNQVLVWRSGVGVTSNGAIVYVSGPGLSVPSLARLLQRAGAVNAMELDINSAWTNFFYFNHTLGAPASPTNGYRLVYNMERPPQRYFEGTARDFVAVVARKNPL